MKAGAGISGTAHVALIAFAIFGGELFAREDPTPLSFAEVELMSGAEFEAAQSTSPEFNADLPSAPKLLESAEDVADVKQAELDTPSTLDAPAAPDAPETGEAVQPLEEPPTQVEIADVGDQPAAPLAPDGDIIIAANETSPDIAPIADTPLVSTPAPSSRPLAPEIDTSAPESEPEPEVVEVAPREPALAPEEEVTPPKPEPEQQVATAPTVRTPVAPTMPQIDTSSPAPEPEPVKPPAEEEVASANDPDLPAPKVAPPPPRKPSNIAAAKRAERLTREAAKKPETGATKTAEAPKSTGTSKTVGKVSFRDREALRVGIKSYFSPPQGLQNADGLAVTIRVQLSEAGKIVGKPEVRRPKGRLNAQQNALKSAGMRALVKSAARGVFSKLPKDKYARWRLIDVTFTPKEIRFL